MPSLAPSEGGAVEGTVPTGRGGWLVSTDVAFLRAVNVAGHGAVAMPALVELFESLGHSDVTTLAQSGNVVFTPAAGSRRGLAAAVEQALATELGLPVRVLLRSRAELQRVAAANPFLGTEDHLANLHVMFLADRPTAAAVATVDPARSPPDELAVAGREVYLRYPNGSGRSKLNGAYLERQLGTHGTARNWNTLIKVLDRLG